VALVALLAIGGVATAGKKTIIKKVDTNVSIAFKGGSSPYYEEAKFKGKVKAGKRCKGRRTVKIVKKSNGTVVGKTKSHQNGKYKTGVNATFRPGARYLARVPKLTYIVTKKKNKRVKVICKSGKSKTITAG
jgi:hypothetical protein